MKQLQGVGAAPGLSIGQAIWWKTEKPIIHDHPVQNPKEENERLTQAIKQAKTEIQELRERTAERIGEEEAAVFDAHLAFLDDPAFTGEMEERIHIQKRKAEAICQEVTIEMRQLMASLEDEYMQARADDISDVGERLLLILTGNSAFDPTQLQPGHIVISEEITPSQTAQFPDGIAGMITSKGSKTAHAAIMARTLGIPAVLGLGASIEQIENDTHLILNGTEGVCLLNPDEELLEQTRKRIDEEHIQKEQALQEALNDAETADGKRIQVFANIGSLKDIDNALKHRAEGVGLFRTEFLYLENKDWPSEEEQYQAYKQVLTSFAPHPVIIRTLDIGGDKDLPYAHLPQEENPFLGHRAIRFCLDQPDIFCTQLKALLRASVHGNLWIMLPMIENMAEIHATKRLINKCKQELKQRNLAFTENIPIGIMIEIPAAAIIADLLATEVDFMSIGTNDLTQYTLAADRGNEKVAHLYDTAHPAVLRLIKMTCDAARKHNIVVGMCGEFAGETEMTDLLVGLGLDELSMSAGSIPIVKQNIRQIDSQQAREVAEKALLAEDGEAVRQILREHLHSNPIKE